ncbi:MAG: class A beta-lactamase-related serine hydrolase [Flavobacteriales bacterium]|nr:MAG: class A beta-lactamase-related serine hydrolase [Flavobacteriales bacterium]
MKNRCFNFLPIFFFFLSINLVIGQNAVAPNLNVSGVSESRLGRYEAFLQKEIDEGRIPGAISLVMRKGQIVHQAAIGLSDVATNTPMAQDQIGHIMSMTKPIVSVAFMMLYEEGLFSLNDPVSKYLPQFKEMKVAKDVNNGIDGETIPALQSITIANLLSHTAGFSHGLGGTKLDNEIANAMYVEPQANIESRVNTLAKLPLIGQPGAQWYYSASPDVLSLLIEHFSGITTAAFLQQRLFDPLGMNDTGYNIKKENQNRWIPVHNINKEGKLIKSPQQLPIEGNTVYGGTHGLFSTASDYMKFAQMLLNGAKWDGTQYLSPKTMEIMTTNQVGDLFQAPGQGFGLGFGVTTDVADSKQLGSVGQYYWSGAYCTYFFVDPKEDMVAILMTQLQPYSNYYGEKLRQMVYQAIVD